MNTDKELVKGASIAFYGDHKSEYKYLGCSKQWFSNSGEGDQWKSVSEQKIISCLNPVLKDEMIVELRSLFDESSPIMNLNDEEYKQRILRENREKKELMQLKQRQGKTLSDAEEVNGLRERIQTARSDTTTAEHRCKELSQQLLTLKQQLEQTTSDCELRVKNEEEKYQQQLQELRRKAEEDTQAALQQMRCTLLEEIERMKIDVSHDTTEDDTDTVAELKVKGRMLDGSIFAKITSVDHRINSHKKGLYIEYNVEMQNQKGKTFSTPILPNSMVRGGKILNVGDFVQFKPYMFFEQPKKCITVKTITV